MQKTVFVCDSCGSQAEPDGRFLGANPVGWFMLRQNADFVPLDLCSLECVQAEVQKAADATTAYYDPSLEQDGGTGIWATQDDDPAQHISMEGNIAVRPEEFQAMLDTAPVVDLRNPSTSSVAKELQRD